MNFEKFFDINKRQNLCDSVCTLYSRSHKLRLIYQISTVVCCVIRTFTSSQNIRKVWWILSQENTVL